MYAAFVEAAADKMIEEGIEAVPSDTIARAVAQGFFADTFEADVLTEVEARNTPADPRQTTLFTRL